MERIQRGRGRLAAFICESFLSCGGQIVLPPGYLAAAYRLVREAGPEVRAQVSRAWRLAFAAEPTPEEVSAALVFLTRQAEQFRSTPTGAKA